jgi:RNA polymerase sigma factor (sigma-70 family)
MGLVLTIAKRYDYELKKSVQGGGGNGVGTILTLSDLVQEGNMGLMEAAERFDVEKGARFATYAGYWVKQRILRAITENSRVIRLPAHGELFILYLIILHVLPIPFHQSINYSFIAFYFLVLDYMVF